MSARDFIGLNGYSSRYWLWGKEDDDLYMRMLASNVSGWARPLADDLPRCAALLTVCVCRSGKFAREAVEVGRYECLDHERNYTNV